MGTVRRIVKSGSDTSVGAALAKHLRFACRGQLAYDFRLAAAEAADRLRGFGGGAGGDVGFGCIFLSH